MSELLAKPWNSDSDPQKQPAVAPAQAPPSFSGFFVEWQLEPDTPRTKPRSN